MLTKHVTFLKACSHRGYLRDYKKLKSLIQRKFSLIILRIKKSSKGEDLIPSSPCLIKYSLSPLKRFMVMHFPSQEMKQNLSIKHYVANSFNALKVQVNVR